MINSTQISPISSPPTRNRVSPLLLCLFLTLCTPRGQALAANNGSLLKFLLPAQSKTFSFSTHFEGNSFFSSKELLTAAQSNLQLFETDHQKISAVDDAAFQIELTYRAAGFPKTEVDYKVIEEKGLYEVHFSIYEGFRILVQAVNIKGNDSFADSYLFSLNPELTAQIDHHAPFPYVSQQMNAFSRSLDEFYLAEGFLDATIAPPELISSTSSDQPSSILIQIFEGKRYMLGTISFESTDPDDFHTELQEIFRKILGVSYNPRLKLLLQSRIYEHYQNKGYADIRTSITTQRHEEQATVDIIIAITKGEQATIQEISILGNEHIAESFIRKKINTAIGDPYTLKKERESISALYQTGLFTKVDFKLTELDQPGQKKLLITVAEKLTKELFIEPGWGSYEFLRLTAGYTDKNFFSTAKSFRLESTASTKSHQISTSFSDPRFLNLPILADMPIYYRYREEPDYTIEERGLSIFFSEKFNNKARLSTGYSFSLNSITDTTTSLESGYLDRYKNASLTINISRDTRDDFFLPTNGYQGHITLEYANTVLGGDLSYLRLTSGFRIFRKISEQTVIAMRYKTGFILPGSGQEGIPLDERFFNGGENSVRSFRESQLGPNDQTGASLGGTAFNTLSLELRRSISKRFAGTLFFDTGNISPNRTTNNGTAAIAASRQDLIDATWSDFFHDFRYAIGCGLQYLLPIGPARIDVAYNPDKRPETESQYALHLSIGMAF